MGSSYSRFFLLVLSMLIATFTVNASEKPWMYLKPDEVFGDKSILLLLNASISSDEIEVNRLIASGIDINTKGLHNISPLFFPVINGNVSGVKILLSHGARVDDYMDNGETIFHVASRFSTNIDVMKTLVKYKGNINLPRLSDGKTALHLIISSDEIFKSKEKMSLLISNGADVNAVDVNGESAMMDAAKLYRFDLVYELLINGADYKIKNKYGKSLSYYLNDIHGLSSESNQVYWLRKVNDYIDKINGSN